MWVQPGTERESTGYEPFDLDALSPKPRNLNADTRTRSRAVHVHTTPTSCPYPGAHLTGLLWYPWHTLNYTPYTMKARGRDNVLYAFTTHTPRVPALVSLPWKGHKVPW